ALLVLPPTARRSRPDSPVPAASDDGPCAARVKAALARADDGDLDFARRELARAASLCPASSSPLREAAGLEFRLERWPEAAQLGGRAGARDSRDLLAWRPLATSRFLEGKPEAALEAWNEVGEPRLDLVRIDGLARTPFRTVYDYLGGDDGAEILTPAAL